MHQAYLSGGGKLANETKFIKQVGGGTSIEDQIRDRLTESFRRAASEGKLLRSPSTWPNRQNVPTLLHPTAYLVARVRELATKFEQTTNGSYAPRIDRSDLYDQYHFTDAAYADIMVTGDDRFYRLTRSLGLNKPHIVWLDDWIAGLVSGDRKN